MKEAHALWQEFLDYAQQDASLALPEVFHFCDTEADADALADLVLSGDKRATASLVWDYQDAGDPLPLVAERSIVTRWNGDAVCVIENTRVDILPYIEIDAEFARVEGEGDKSLAYWRAAHWSYFSNRCAQMGRTSTEDMAVVCQRFKVIFPLALAD
jgi:uncharacterized protein YhfF